MRGIGCTRNLPASRHTTLDGALLARLRTDGGELWSRRLRGATRGRRHPDDSMERVGSLHVRMLGVPAILVADAQDARALQLEVQGACSRIIVALLAVAAGGALHIERRK